MQKMFTTRIIVTFVIFLHVVFGEFPDFVRLLYMNMSTCVRRICKAFYMDINPQRTNIYDPQNKRIKGFKFWYFARGIPLYFGEFL